MADAVQTAEATPGGQVPACRLGAALDRIAALRRQLPVARASSDAGHAIAALGTAVSAGTVEHGKQETVEDLVAENAHLRARLAVAEARARELEGLTSAASTAEHEGEGSDADSGWEWVTDTDTWSQALGDELSRQGRRAVTEALQAAAQIDCLAAASSGLGLAVRPGAGGLVAAASSGQLAPGDLATLSQAWARTTTARSPSESFGASADAPCPRCEVSTALPSSSDETKTERDLAALAHEVASLVKVLASTKRELSDVRTLRLGRAESRAANE